MVKKYAPSHFNPTEPLELRHAQGMAQASGILNRLTEASAGRSYVVAEQYALELLRTAETAVRYFQQFTRPTTVLDLPVALGASKGSWDPNESTNHLLPPNTLEAGDYYISVGTYGDFEPGDLLVALGKNWVRLPKEQAENLKV